MKSVIPVALALMTACGVAPLEEDAGVMLDAGADAGTAPANAGLDGGTDSGPDAGLDGGSDAGPDAGCECNEASTCCDGCFPVGEGQSCDTPIPGTTGAASCVEGQCVGSQVCECSAGPCCDGCLFRGTDAVCEAAVWLSSECTGDVVGCPGHTLRITEDFADRHCSGASVDCDGDLGSTTTIDRRCFDLGATPVYCDETIPQMATCTHTCSGT